MRMPMRSAAVLGALLLASAGPALATPGAGRYAAELCVATKPGTEPACGAAEAEVHSASRLDVRVSDIRYLLVLRSSQLDVSTRHGSLQVDEFSSPYEWSGTAGAEVLRFGDEAKDVRYEIRLGARRPR